MAGCPSLGVVLPLHTPIPLNNGSGPWRLALRSVLSKYSVLATPRPSGRIFGVILKRKYRILQPQKTPGMPTPLPIATTALTGCVIGNRIGSVLQRSPPSCPPWNRTINLPTSAPTPALSSREPAHGRASARRARRVLVFTAQYAPRRSR